MIEVKRCDLSWKNTTHLLEKGITRKMYEDGLNQNKRTMSTFSSKPFIVLVLTYS